MSGPPCANASQTWNSNSWTKQSLLLQSFLPLSFTLCVRLCVFFFSFLLLSDAFSTHWCFIVFSVYSRLPLCILNALWPLSISRGKPIKVSSNQEMVSAVVSRWCSHSSLSGSARWSLALAVLYIVWCLRQREGSHLFLSWTNQLHSLWWIHVEAVLCALENNRCNLF